MQRLPGESTSALYGPSAHQFPIIRFGLSTKLKAESEFNVVGEADSCRECRRKIVALRPDVVLIDLSLNDFSGLDALQKIREVSPEVSLVVYTARKSDPLISDSISIGIQGFVMKDAPIERMVQAIRAVGRGRSYLDPFARSTTMGNGGQKNQGSQFKQGLLTDREAEILAVLATGKSNKEIANWGAMSGRTVEHHVSMILQKLDTSNRTEAVVTAIQLGIIDDPARQSANDDVFSPPQGNRHRHAGTSQNYQRFSRPGRQRVSRKDFNPWY